MYIVHVTANNEAIQAQQQLLQDLYPHWSAEFPGNQKLCCQQRGWQIVFTSIREHAKHWDFCASMSRNKKFALQACEQRKNLGSTSKRALVYILRANRAKVKFCAQLKILMYHSSPLILGEKATFPNCVIFYLYTRLYFFTRRHNVRFLG